MGVAKPWAAALVASGWLAVAGGAVASGAGAGPATTLETAIEEVVVTADLRGGTLLDVPMSVSVIDAGRIRGRNAEHLEDVLNQVPNVNVATGSSRARFFQIRGIGERGQFAEPLNPSVGLIVDGVDFSGVGTAAVLFDVEQVEVLRGPQSTRYGANALAGLINVNTRGPTAQPAHELSAEYANYGSWALSGVASGPLNDRLGYRIGVQQRRSDGFVENRFLNDDTVSGRAEQVLRARLDFAASDRLKLTTTLARVDINNGYDAFSLENDRHTRSDAPGMDDQRSVLFSGAADYLAGAGVRLLGLVAVARSDSDYGYDEDWTFAGFHPLGYSSTDRYQRDRRMVSGELRALSTAASRIFAGTTDWTMGLYAIDQQVALKRSYTFLPTPFASDFGSRRLAAFGELEAAPGNALTLTGGVRIERRVAAYDDTRLVRFRPGETLLAGRLAAEYALTPLVSAHATLARGFKAGGFNTDGTLDADLRSFGQETLWSGEVGLKGLLAGGRLSLRAALFHMRRDDVQIASSLVRVRAGGSAEFIAFTGNAAAGFNRGAEVEFDWRATDGLLLFGALGLLRAEYQDFINAAGADLDGRRQAHAPRYQFHLGGRWDVGRGFHARLEVEGRGRFFYSDGHDARSDAYQLVHGTLGWDRDRWQIAIFARNILNTDYALRGYRFGNDPRTDYAPNDWIQLGEPARIGIRVDIAPRP